MIDTQSIKNSFSPKIKITQNKSYGPKWNSWADWFSRWRIWKFTFKWKKALLFLLMLIFKSWSIHHLQLFLENKTVKISGSNTCQIVYLSSFVLMICAAKNAILCEFSWIEARLLKDNLISNYVLIQIKDADVLTWHA